MRSVIVRSNQRTRPATSESAERKVRKPVERMSTRLQRDRCNREHTSHEQAGVKVLRHIARTALLLTVASSLSSCFIVGGFRYGIPNMKSGDHDEGDPAPNVELVALTGETIALDEHMAGRPLVLVFGSFT